MVERNEWYSEINWVMKTTNKPWLNDFWMRLSVKIEWAGEERLEGWPGRPPSKPWYDWPMVSSYKYCFKSSIIGIIYFTQKFYISSILSDWISWIAYMKLEQKLKTQKWNKRFFIHRTLFPFLTQLLRYRNKILIFSCIKAC